MLPKESTPRLGRAVRAGVDPMFDAAGVADWTQVAANVVTVAAALVLGLWTYLRFIAQQLVRPAIEFVAEVVPMHRVSDRVLIKCVFTVRNAGVRECRAWLYWRLLSLDDKATPRRLGDDNESMAGRVKFQYEVPTSKDVRAGTNSFGREAPAGFVPVVNYPTFVAPTVMQRYELVTSVGLDTAAVVLMGNIQYQRSRPRAAALDDAPLKQATISKLARLVLRLSPRELKETTQDHTAQAAAPIEIASNHQSILLDDA